MGHSQILCLSNISKYCCRRPTRECNRVKDDDIFLVNTCDAVERVDRSAHDAVSRLLLGAQYRRVWRDLTPRANVGDSDFNQALNSGPSTHLMLWWGKSPRWKMFSQLGGTHQGISKVLIVKGPYDTYGTEDCTSKLAHKHYWTEMSGTKHSSISSIDQIPGDIKGHAPTAHPGENPMSSIVLPSFSSISPIARTESRFEIFKKHVPIAPLEEIEQSGSVQLNRLMSNIIVPRFISIG